MIEAAIIAAALGAAVSLWIAQRNRRRAWGDAFDTMPGRIHHRAHRRRGRK